MARLMAGESRLWPVPVAPYVLTSKNLKPDGTAIFCADAGKLDAAIPPVKMPASPNMDRRFIGFINWKRQVKASLYGKTNRLELVRSFYYERAIGKRPSARSLRQRVRIQMRQFVRGP